MNEMIKPNSQLAGVLMVMGFVSLSLGQIMAFRVCFGALVVMALLIAIDAYTVVTGGFDDIIDEVIDIQVKTGKNL